MSKLLLMVGAAVFGSAVSVPATAATAPLDTTFYFSGTCSDCQGTATGELVLSNYSYGEEISAANFVSFHYDGTDLLNAYTIAASDNPLLGGEIDAPLPATENVFILADTGSFTSSTSGFWCTGSGACSDDLGFAHEWSLTPDAAPAPEPASWAMFIGGFGLIGAGMRRRRTSISFARLR